MGRLEAIHDPLGRQMDGDGQVHEGVDAGVDRLLVRPGQSDEDRVRTLQLLSLALTELLLAMPV